MTEQEHDEQQREARVPNWARASARSAVRGARHYAESARAWVRAPGLEDHIRERDARAHRTRAARDERMRARRPKRASAHPSAPPRALTDIEVRARAFGVRALRTGIVLALPCALIVYPPWALFGGEALPLLLWPATYGYLVWDGWASQSDQSPAASAEADTVPIEHDERPTTILPRFTRSPKPNQDEVAIIDRLHGWGDRATERRLHEVYPDPPVIDESGMLVPLTFGGQWTPAKLDAQIDQFRALLAVPDNVRTQIKPGGTADRATLRIRTRIRELDLTWRPGREGIGLDAETGDIVPVDITDRILVAGMSGAGKSVALRVLMASALAMPHTALVILDLKVEGALWAHTARVESEPSGIESAVAELVAEMRERETIMREHHMDMWEPTADRPRIVIVVDEGAELITEVPDAVSGLRSLARRARSAQMPLWWATQKPTVTGSGRGLDSAISMQLTTQIALAVPSPTETRNVLGEDATMRGWHAEDLQKGGWALVRVQGADRMPDPVRAWFMTKEDVKALEPRSAWRRQPAASDRAGTDALTVALTLSEGRNGVSTTQLASTLGVTDAEVHETMRLLGATPEPNAFALGDGTKARGYRRSTLETAHWARASTTTHSD